VGCSIISAVLPPAFSSKCVAMIKSPAHELSRCWSSRHAHAYADILEAEGRSIVVHEFLFTALLCPAWTMLSNSLKRVRMFVQVS